MPGQETVSIPVVGSNPPQQRVLVFKANFAYLFRAVFCRFLASVCEALLRHCVIVCCKGVADVMDFPISPIQFQG